MGFDREYVHPIQQPVQLTATQFDHFHTVIAGPREPMLLKLFLPQHKAVALPKQELDLIASAIAECEEMRAEGIKFEFFFNKY